MISRKVLWTLCLDVFYVTAALASDYTFNVLIGHNPRGFTPLGTVLITLMVGTPVTYSLISQRFDLSRVIAERKRLETELIGALAEAETATRAKSEFLANMTHELRTPLNAIIGFSGILGRSAGLSPADARYVALVNDASHTLLHIINDVLDYSKLEAGQIGFERTAVDPADLAASTAALLADEATRKGLDLAVSVTAPPVPLLTDGGRLRQVIVNFLSNAIKFTAEGRIELAIDVGPTNGGARMRVEVRDTGIGVPPDQIDRIFRRFVQADASVSRQFGGTGLGLAISKRIIDGLDGTIGVFNNQSGGATFWFEIIAPLADPARSTPILPVPPLDLTRQARVLLVDDNPNNRELVSALLGAFDLVIVTAEDGAEAVAAVEQAARDGSPFDIVLMDIHMPNLDGLTATRRIRALEADRQCRTPIIAMTANVLPDQVATCLEAGMDGHVGKPIVPEGLMSTLACWLPTAA